MSLTRPKTVSSIYGHRVVRRGSDQRVMIGAVSHGAPMATLISGQAAHHLHFAVDSLFASIAFHIHYSAAVALFAVRP